MTLTKITSTNIEAGGVSLDNLADSGVTAGTHGHSSGIPVITVNSKGIITGVEVVTVAGVSDFTYNSSTEVLTISTADGSTFNADISTLASQTYVDTAESDAVTTANAYTDTRESAITTAYENYTDTAVSNLVDTAPAALDTLNELAAALGDDANFATTVSTNLGNKVDKINITGATVGTSTAIPVITFNAQGQITSASTTPITVGDGTLTVNSGTGLSGSGTFTANQTSNGTITLSHADTSTQSSVNNSGGTVIQDVTVDGFGHVTGLASTDLTTQFLGINAKAADSDLLDGLNSTQFLRSDANDQTTNILAIGSASGAINGEKLRVTDTGTFIASFQRTDGTPHLLFKGTGGISGNTGRFYMDNGAFQLSQGDSTGAQSGNIWLHGTSNGNVGIGTTSPDKALDVATGDDNAIRIRNENGANTNGLSLAVGSGSPWMDITEGKEFRIKHTPYANIGDWNSGSNARFVINPSGNIGIGTTSPSQKLDVNGVITHSGLAMSTGSNVDQYVSYVKSLQLTGDWQDTGIDASDLATGTYIIQVYVNDQAVGGGHYDYRYAGTLAWFATNTNGSDSHEIILQGAGHASNNRRIFLRTIETPNADTSDLKLQISGNGTTSGASNYSFTFRRMI